MLHSRGNEMIILIRLYYTRNAVLHKICYSFTNASRFTVRENIYILFSKHIFAYFYRCFQKRIISRHFLLTVDTVLVRTRVDVVSYDILCILCTIYLSGTWKKFDKFYVRVKTSRCGLCNLYAWVSCSLYYPQPRHRCRHIIMRTKLSFRHRCIIILQLYALRDI